MTVSILSAGFRGVLVCSLVLLQVLTAFPPADNEAGEIVLAVVEEQTVFGFFGRHNSLISLSVVSKATGIFLLPSEGVFSSGFGWKKRKAQ